MILKTLQAVFTNFLLGTQYISDSVEKTSASMFVVSLGQTFDGMSSTLFGK